MDPTNPNIQYAGTDNGLYKSTDGGTTWNNYKNGLPSNPYMFGLVINPTNPSILYAALYVNGVYKSTDGGVNWTYVSPQITTFTNFLGLAINPSNPNIVYVGIYHGGVWKTTDGGANWTMIYGGDAGEPVLDPNNPNTVYETANNNFIKSTDGGATWVAANGLPGASDVIAIDPNNSNIVYTGVGYGVSNPGLYKSTDGGANFTQLTSYPGGPFQDQALTTDPTRPNTIYAGSNSAPHTYRSTDGGASWSELSGGAVMPSADKQLVVPANQSCNLYAATYAGLYVYNLNSCPPVVSPITVVTSPVQVNNPITASATFTDPNTTSTHIAVWNWGDLSTPTTGTVVEPNGSNPGTVGPDSHIYTAAGVYTITLTVTNNQGAIGTQTYQYVSVYNPTPQGLFSGAHLFSSPAGAYPQLPNLTGDVTFGLSYKYSGTMPVGDKQFVMNFKAANLLFNATTISSLVIANGQATLTGTGTINGGLTTYNFLVVGVNGGGIRVQITDPTNNNAVIYDTQPGAPVTATPTTSVTGQVIVH